jgi:hypothetical protein
LDAHKAKAPWKLTPFHHYFKLHYKTRVSAEYVRRFKLARDEYDAATEAERVANNLKKPVGVVIRSSVGREFWLLESDEFCENIGQLADAQHAIEMEEWEALQQAPKTPSEFHQ